MLFECLFIIGKENREKFSDFVMFIIRELEFRVVSGISI